MTRETAQGSWAQRYQSVACLVVISFQPLLACLFVWVVHDWVHAVGDHCSALEAESKSQGEANAGRDTRLALLEEKCSRHDEQIHNAFEKLKARQDEEEDRLSELERRMTLAGVDRSLRFAVNTAMVRAGEDWEPCLTQE